MRTKKPPKSFIVSDPLERAFLAVLRGLPPEALEDLTEAMRAMDERRPAQEQRSAWLTFFERGGYLDPQERAAGMTRLFSARLH
jgi:hypothetical protein